MNITRDIYYTIDLRLLENDFWGLDINSKKQLIDTEFKNYLISKINFLTKKELLLNPNLTVEELVLILSNNIEEKYRFDNLCHLVHYIIQIAGSLQEWAIIWYIEDEDKLKQPISEFNENGLWDKIKTSENMDCTLIFNHVYNIFNNNFMKKNNHKKLFLKDSN